MRLDKLHLRNFRSYTDSTFSFHPKLNLIVGANGSGKSSLLFGIRCAVSGVIAPMAEYRGSGISKDDVRFETAVYGRQIRATKHFPATVDAEGEIDGKVVSWQVKRTNDVNTSETSVSMFQMAVQLNKTNQTDTSLVLPLVAFYGAQRSGTGGGGGLAAAATEKLSRISGYQSWNNAFVNRTELENWVIGKTLEGLQLLDEGAPPLDDAEDELAIVNSVVDDCIPEAKRLRYDLRLRDLFIEFKDGRAVPFSSLSDGQQGMFLLIADIARRMCLLNPNLGDAVLTETPGVLIVDEIDIHLHPEWQRRILRVLSASFPKIQIFASSHSPQMIGGIQPDQVLVLKGGKVSEPRVTFGLDSARILEEVMSVPGREPDVEDALDKVFVEIEAGRLSEAKILLQNVKQSAPGQPEFAQLEALLRRKELLGR